MQSKEIAKMDEKQCVNEDIQVEYIEPGVSIQVQSIAFLFKVSGHPDFGLAQRGKPQ